MTDEVEAQQVTEENWEARAAEYLAGWRRAQADYANLQRETAVQRTEMASHAIGESVRGFLPVFDYFKRAMQHIPTAEIEAVPGIKQWCAGVTQIENLFRMTLKQFGVEELETIGKKFDPATMEAVKEEVQEGAAPGSVLSETEGGYIMGEKILKPARVIVAADHKNN